VQLCETGIDKIDNSGNDTKGLSKFAKDMSNFNKVTNVAGIWLSQLNRGVMSRADRRPWNSDLMATSALENAADWIVLLFRPGAYEDWSEQHNENGKAVTKYNYKGNSYNLYDCEYILSKNRRFGGKTGSWWEWQEQAQPASNQFPVKEQPHAAPLQEPAQADSRDFEGDLPF
jgi:replicative DNA helicase